MARGWLYLFGENVGLRVDPLSTPREEKLPGTTSQTPIWEHQQVSQAHLRTRSRIRRGKPDDKTMTKRKAKDVLMGVEPKRSSRRISKSKDDRVAQTLITSNPRSKKANGSTKKEAPDVKKEEHAGLDEKVNKKVPIKNEVETSTAKVQPKPAPNGSARQYWLMKAEPESRLEKGKDIKFSIDDLASKSEPEPWDGIRAYSARNNLRAMKKGDLAFFYHSSCKVPAIVGIMEIVQEHTPDLSAHDPDAPYYDPKSKPEDPKWSVVHVEFRQKLQTPITLKELKSWYGETGHALREMQMLRIGRMSVSKVTSNEWDFLIGEMQKNGDGITL